MQRIILRTTMIAGLIVSASGIASAAPATHLLDRNTTGATSNVEHIDYNWNHHRYHHRSWDKKNHHWHYSNLDCRRSQRDRLQRALIQDMSPTNFLHCSPGSLTEFTAGRPALWPHPAYVRRHQEAFAAA
jgi:hypothetical protein